MIDYVAWHDRARHPHEQLVTQYKAEGFRLSSLSMYGTTTDPRYVAVAIRRPFPFDTHERSLMNEAEWLDQFEKMAKLGYGPYILTANGPRSSARFAACFRQMGTTPLTRHRLTADELRALNKEALAEGRILRWADAYGEPGDVRYTAIWTKNSDDIAWNCEAVDDPPTVLQQRIDAIVTGGGRPALIARVPGGLGLEMFVDSRVGRWMSRGGLTSSAYQDLVDEQKAKGLAPICVNASGSGDNARFASIFVERELPDARVWRASGPRTVDAIDDAIKTYMQNNRIRQAALAIVQGTRLVYAKGYTWAEPDYPTVERTTRFRLASGSKLFAAVAMYRLLELDTSITIDTPIQSILALKTPRDTDPTSTEPRFGAITIRHLLESTSGLDNESVKDVKVCKAFLKDLPCKPIEVARYLSSLKLTNDPGDTTQVRYGNGYGMLGRVINSLAKTARFETALRNLVLQPLGITGVRSAVSLFGEQEDGEARYQMTQNVTQGEDWYPLITAPSVLSADQPLVAYQYGKANLENLDGSAGLSASVTDVARLVAMLACHTNNPVLSSASIDALFTRAAFATANYTGPSAKGYHGLDKAFINNAATHDFKGRKGGRMGGTGTDIVIRTRGVSYVFAQSDNPRVPKSWDDSVLSIGDAYSWPSDDLFVSDLGLAALAP